MEGNTCSHVSILESKCTPHHPTRELIRIAPSATKALASKPTVPVNSRTAFLPHYTLGYEACRNGTTPLSGWLGGTLNVTESVRRTADGAPLE